MGTCCKRKYLHSWEEGLQLSGRVEDRKMPTIGPPRDIITTVLKFIISIVSYANQVLFVHTAD